MTISTEELTIEELTVQEMMTTHHWSTTLRGGVPIETVRNSFYEMEQRLDTADMDLLALLIHLRDMNTPLELMSAMAPTISCNGVRQIPPRHKVGECVIIGRKLTGVRNTPAQLRYGVVPEFEWKWNIMAKEELHGYFFNNYPRIISREAISREFYSGIYCSMGGSGTGGENILIRPIYGKKTYMEQRCSFCNEVHDFMEMRLVTENEACSRMRWRWACDNCIGGKELRGEIVRCPLCGTHHWKGKFWQDMDEEERNAEARSGFEWDHVLSVRETEVINNLCPTCFTRNYIACEDCGTWTYRAESERVVDRDRRVCQRCVQDYERCEDCEELFEDTTYHGSERLCYECAEARNEAYAQEEEERERERERFVQHIREYHSEWDIVKRLMPGEVKMSTSRKFHNYPFFGIELEVDCDEISERERHRIAGEALEILNKESAEEWKAERDGSLDYGFELISQPMSMAYWDNQWPLMERAIKSLKKNGMESHNRKTCGLHFHISRIAFGNTPEEREAGIARLLIIFDRFWPEIKAVSRRSQGQIAQWANVYELKNKLGPRLYDRVFFEDDTDENKGRDLVAEVSDTQDRYSAVNLKRYVSVEIRAMRGTLKNETFRATQCIIFALFACSVGLKMQEIMKIRTFSELLSRGHEICITYFGGRELPWGEMRAYCKKRGVWPEMEDEEGSSEGDE